MCSIYVIAGHYRIQCHFGAKCHFRNQNVTHYVEK